MFLCYEKLSKTALSTRAGEAIAPLELLKLRQENVEFTETFVIFENIFLPRLPENFLNAILSFCQTYLHISLQDKKKYEVSAGSHRTSEDMIAMYSDFVERFPIIGIIDGMSHKVKISQSTRRDCYTIL